MHYRADKFVEKLIDYLIGRMLIADAHKTALKPIVEVHKTSNPDTIDQDAEVENIVNNKKKILTVFSDNGNSETEPEAELLDNVAKNKKIILVLSSGSDNSESEPEPEILASREFENWRGKVTDKTKKRKPGKYLGQRMDEVSDALIFGSYSLVPLLRNGSSLNLQPSVVKGRSLTAINTCAFDSLTQSLFIACLDFANINRFARTYRRFRSSN